MKAEGNLDMDVFLDEVREAQTGYFSNQTECDVIYPSYLNIGSFQEIFMWVVATFGRWLRTNICREIYPGTVEVAVIEIYVYSLGNRFF